MASTINDVAKLAGVSRQTVSRVLNEPGLVNGQTLQNVRKAMEMLDYHPNITARNLANNQVKTIGLFMPFTVNQVRQNLFFSTVSATICHYCADKDFVLQLFTSLNRDDYSVLFKKLHREKRVGGLILTCPSVNNNEIIDLLAADIPFILIGRPGVELEQANYVDVDNVEGARLLGEHLFGLGHGRIAVLNAPAALTLAEDMSAGIELAREAAGIPSANITELNTDLTLESGYQAGKQLLSGAERPTAIIAADDLLAVGVAKAAAELGLAIPGDLSLASAVKNGWGDLLPMQLTYVDTQFEQLGTIAANYIMGVITGRTRAAFKQILDVRLVEGNSCAPA